MCDKECLKHLIIIETEIGVLKTDIRWLKRLIGGVFIILGALFGVDVTGLM